MPEEKIVAVFDSTEHGHAAIRALIDAGVKTSHVEGHDENTLAQRAKARADAGKGDERDYWRREFGGHASDRDVAVYHGAVTRGGHVVTVRTEKEDAARVLDILERHHPLDIDDHATTLGVTTAPAASPVGAAAPGDPLTAPRRHRRYPYAEPPEEV